jgi:hypothetical protein
MRAEEVMRRFDVKLSRHAEQREDLSLAEKSEGRGIKVDHWRAM